MDNEDSEEEEEGEENEQGQVEQLDEMEKLRKRLKDAGLEDALKDDAPGSSQLARWNYQYQMYTCDTKLHLIQSI